MPSDFRVVLRSVDRSLRCRAYLGDSPPTPSGGGGGHEVVPIPGRRSVLVWRNADLIRMALSIVVDDFADGTAVAGEYSGLVRMWRPLEPIDEPPPIKVEADGDTVPFSHLTWRVTGLDWGDTLANDYGNRTRQAFTVSLTEDNPEQRIEAQTGGSGAKRRADKRNAGSGPSKPTVHTVVAGEDLATIGAAYKITWKQIGLAQSPPIQDPRNVTVGQTITIPQSASYRDKAELFAARVARDRR